MAYVPTEWKSGDIVTASKLNNIENGLKALNVLVTKVTTTENTQTLNRTFKQIKDAFNAGHPVYILDEATSFYASIIMIDAVNFKVSCFNSDGDLTTFTADSNTGYPSLTING